MSQEKRVLAYIAEHGSITNLEATRMKPPIMRLASRVFDLRSSGWNLPSITETSEGASYSRYFFSENDRERHDKC